MEFPELAHACEKRGCSEKNDFLPFTCNGCGKKFCLEHHRHEAHDCPVPPRDDKYAPTCPLCMQAVTIMPGQDSNEVIDKHIRAGCPTSAVKTKQNKCSFKGCREKEFIPISCKLCKQPFCLKHRFETDHDCPANKKPAPGAAQQAASSVAGMAAAARAGVAASLNPKPSSQPKPTIAQVPPKAGSQKTMAPQGAAAGSMGVAGGAAGGRARPPRQQQKHSNTPKAPTGASGIPERERFLVSAYFPTVSGRAPEYHVLSSQWSVGKAIDVLSSRGSIRNDNNKAGAERLNLFNQAGTKLQSSSSLEDCVVQGTLSGGCVVILEYGDALAGHDPKLYAAMSNKDCAIM